MGREARLRAAQSKIVFHHTSTLCTNLIWMSGFIEIEGRQELPLHPQLGTIQGNLRFRRDCKDFPPVAWFTSQPSVPRCLVLDRVFFEKNGDVVEVPIATAVANAIALHRIALGFQADAIPVTRWVDYYGYATAEGKALNETAREMGDDPRDWYVAETAVSLDHLCEYRVAKSQDDLRMERHEELLRRTKEMLAAMKKKKMYVPPSWLAPEQLKELTSRLDLKEFKV